MVSDHNQALVAAFWGARWQREKTMTPLSEVLIGDLGEAERQAQTPDEIIGAMDAWVVATGGTLDEPKKPRGRRARTNPEDAPADPASQG